MRYEPSAARLMVTVSPTASSGSESSTSSHKAPPSRGTVMWSPALLPRAAMRASSAGVAGGGLGCSAPYCPKDCGNDGAGAAALGGVGAAAAVEPGAAAGAGAVVGTGATAVGTVAAAAWAPPGCGGAAGGRGAAGAAPRPGRLSVHGPR